MGEQIAFSKYRVTIWWYENHGTDLKIKAKSKEEAIKRAQKVVENLGDHGFSFTDTYSDKGSYGVDEEAVCDLGNGVYSVPIWWDELHGDTVTIEFAYNEDNARQQAKQIVENLGDWGYSFSDTYLDKGSWGVDDDIVMIGDKDLSEFYLTPKEFSYGKEKEANQIENL